MIGPGSVVTRNVPAGAIASGNPAQVTGYADHDSRICLDLDNASTPTVTPNGITPLLGEAALWPLTTAADLRGSLTVADFESQLPFQPKRIFTVYDVPTQYVRGEHAHRECHQFLQCLNGSINVLLDDGTNRKVVVLSSPTYGLYIPPMIWASQYNYSSDAISLVLASHPYDPADYIRDYNAFLDSVA
jgi:dTDP-4-dehydrorhamnose 3,5-epimerase-like enzyme